MRAPFAASALLSATLLLGGCSSVGGIVQHERVTGTEAALVDAGFHIEPGNTRDRIAELRVLPPFVVVPRNRAGDTVYVYADPVTCHCQYVGSAQQYAEYQRQRNAALNAAESREAFAAEQRIETYDRGQTSSSSPWLW